VAGDRLFLDTYYVQALLNPKDPHHHRARALLQKVKRAASVITTEAVLVEVGNALCGTPRLRKVAASFIRRLYSEENMTVVAVDNPLFNRALDMYEKRQDKDWGLTDCISFVVIDDQGLSDAATGDRHFVQAGFRALMLSPRP
jgi:predicted nucleic acid-binding protein